ncbi:MAG: hypothetical protein QM270_09330 [Bacillota bacterium]|nr:hypothetical protein [Bacillota bacterium]
MRTKTSLSGLWDLYFGPDEGHLPTSAAAAAAAGYRQIPATVPGNVELDLVAAGLLPDPLIHDNTSLCQPFEYYNWVFTCSFELDPAQRRETSRLELDGVNTYATILINGEEAGTTDNMLIPHSFDITGLLHWDRPNTITVAIRSSMNVARSLPYTAAAIGPEHSDEATQLRMPPHSFGWDIMPRLLSAGIWRDIRIVHQGPTRLHPPCLATRHLSPDHRRATLTAAVHFESPLWQLPIHTIRVHGRCGDSVIDSSFDTHFSSAHFDIEVENPELWWPHGYGEAKLYHLTVDLLLNGELLDSLSFDFGIRTLLLDCDYSLDRGKQRFRFIANGIPVYVLGSNWVPLSALHSLDEGRVDQAIELAVDCGCNLLRCWGGNVYESDRFYELCDRAGLMIWQDFSLACYTQATDHGFRERMRVEATAVVQRLRNHASLALWSGDNEVDQFYQRFPRGHARHNPITREVLPAVVAAHDPYRSYIPSSPYMPENYDNDLQGPEQHLWGPRDDFKGDFYRLNSAILASEIGYHGCPAVRSLRRFIRPEQLWPFAGQRDWLVHNTERPLYRRGYDRNELMARQVAILFGQVPETLEDFALASQISQAEAKKFFIESFRLRRGETSGIIWWNVLDGWPQISDAVVDYYFVKKLAWYWIRRSQRRIQLMMSEYQAWGHELVCVNDTLEEQEVHWSLSRGSEVNEVASGVARVPAGSSLVLDHINANPSLQELYLMRWESVDGSSRNHYITGPRPFSLAQFRDWLDLIRRDEPVLSDWFCD